MENVLLALLVAIPAVILLFQPAYHVPQGSCSTNPSTVLMVLLQWLVRLVVPSVLCARWLDLKAFVNTAWLGIMWILLLDVLLIAAINVLLVTSIILVFVLLVLLDIHLIQLPFLDVLMILLVTQPAAVMCAQLVTLSWIPAVSNVLLLLTVQDVTLWLLLGVLAAKSDTILKLSWTIPPLVLMVPAQLVFNVQLDAKLAEVNLLVLPACLATSLCQLEPQQ